MAARPGPDNLSNLKDILMTYNKITEACFYKCAANFNYRVLTDNEQHCVDNCSAKFISSNQRLMGTFMEIQSVKQKKLFDEAVQQQEAAEAQQLQAAGSVTADPVAPPAAAAAAPLAESPQNIELQQSFDHVASESHVASHVGTVSAAALPAAGGSQSLRQSAGDASLSGSMPDNPNLYQPQSSK